MVERCKQCNGIISVGRSATHSLMNTTIKAAAWCKCPDVVHDGNLDNKGYDDDFHAAVEIEPDYNPFSAHGSKLVNIHGGYGDIENWNVYLNPQQALSLLQWLQQEKETLEKLALDVD